ncbi:hypothetical protein NL108_018157 [Boleophthalmus pectinirostris]|nr:hypothetical protein NL108_018157 [Boleophthalmus pectinirostris]
MVTCLYPSDLVSSELVSSELDLFCLQLLPQRLEVQWGYRLYIPGRDDCPGEAMADALSDAVRRSRTLLLLLRSSSSSSGPQGATWDSDDLQPLCYEQRVGLYDALINKELRVVLIEIGGPVDYSRLPQSVQYLRRTQGALQWRPRGTRRFLCPERSFWNRLRYNMPPVPSGRTLQVPSDGTLQVLSRGTLQVPSDGTLQVQVPSDRTLLGPGASSHSRPSSSNKAEAKSKSLSLSHRGLLQVEV